MASLLVRFSPKHSLILIRGIRGNPCSDGTILPSLNALGRRSVDTKRKTDKSLVTTLSNIEDLSVLKPVANEVWQVDNRKCHIYKPSQNVMQSGEANSRNWHLKFDTRDRWQSSLVGWGASNDPVSGVELMFESSEQAVQYCEKMGYQYCLHKDNTSSKPKIKSYSDNFSWWKRTRIANK